jgi:ribosomal protein S27AE
MGYTIMEEYRLVMQYKNKKGQFVDRDIVTTGEAKPPTSIMDLGLRHIQQIEILRRIQDSILNSQSQFLKENISHCPQCANKLRKNGVNLCTFNAVLTDHKVPVYRQICGKCKWSSVPSIGSLLGTHMHPDLTKLQCDEVSKQSYPKAQNSLNSQSAMKRKVNSMMTLHGVIERISANIINVKKDTDDSIDTKDNPCTELVIQVDGGHLNTKKESSRSFEALTSVVYQPKNVVFKENTARGEITQKHCVASALDDEQVTIKQLTLIAAQKEGLSFETNVTAICDGARNCWNVIEHLSAHCRSIVYILDWFHIAMKFKNLGHCDTAEFDKKIEHIKWCLWNGNTTLFYKRVDELMNEIDNEKMLKKITLLREYIINNESKIVNYSERQRKGEVFTSNNAECTVESLINQRCKGKKHMQWSREGVHAILQIRAASASNDWNMNWERYVVGAFQKAA